MVLAFGTGMVTFDASLPELPIGLHSTAFRELDVDLSLEKAMQLHRDLGAAIEYARKHGIKGN